MLATYLSFVSFSFIDTSLISVLELLFVPALAIYYLLTSENKSLFFSLFLVTYCLSDIIHLIDGNSLSETLYFVCNLLYIIAYLFLILEIFKTLNFKILYQKFLLQSIVLLILVVYLFIVFCDIIDPILFETNALNWVRFIEHSYNLVLLILLATSFLNFLENDTKKSLLLFLGCLSISFSDFLLIGYYYLSDLEWLNYIAMFLNFLAFILLYIQSNIKAKANNETKVYV